MQMPPVKNYRQLLAVTTNKWYLVTTLKFYQSYEIKTSKPWEWYKYMRKLTLEHFLYSPNRIQAGKKQCQVGQ